MGWPSPIAVCLALTFLAAPPAARAGELYSYTDADGVMHFTNAPSDARFRRVSRTSEVAGLYRPAPAGPSAPQGRQLPAGLRSGPYLDHVRAAAAKYNLPEELILAVMAVESNFNPRAISDKGAIGLMQLMPKTADELQVADAWDPAQNIEGGSRYLRLMANLYAGDMVRMLAAYNAGPEAVRRAGDAVPNIPETREYVQKVIALYRANRAGR